MLFDDASYSLAAICGQNVTILATKFRNSSKNCPALPTFAILLAAGLLIPRPLPAAPPTPAYELTSSLEAGETRQVKVVLEVTGELKLNADGRQVTRLPLQVRADLLYAERVLVAELDQTLRRDARQYDRAEAQVKVGDSSQEHRISDQRSLIVADRNADRVTLFSPHGPLTRAELELVDIQASSTLLAELLPQAEVRIGDDWPHDDSLVAQFFTLDAVHQNKLRSKLRKVNGSLAIVDLAGSVSGAIGGVSTDLEIKAVYNFNMDSGQITWLAMSMSEDRAIGHAEPGLKVTGRLRLATSTCSTPPELTSDALAGLGLDPSPGSTLIDYATDAGGFRLLHDRNWHVMVDRHDVAILRRVEDGDLVAQCNISSLPDLKPGQHPQLESFQADVKRALGDNFGEFLEASQSSSESGLQVLRTVVSGAVSEIPIQWTYYHFSDSRGRQLSLVFTLDSKLIERFAENDAGIVSTLEFRPRAESGQEAELGARTSHRASAENR